MYDLQEQEQIDNIKAFWKQYGSLISTFIVAAIVAVLAGQGWKSYRLNRAQHASDAYVALEQAVESKDAAKIKAAQDKLLADFPSSPYAARAVLMEAKRAMEAGDTKTAADKLVWAITNSDEDGVKDIARLRLSAVQLDQKQYDAALKTLEAAPADAYSALFSNARGDIYTAQGKAAEAAKAYQQSLNKLDKGAPEYQIVQMKLDALGGAK